MSAVQLSLGQQNKLNRAVKEVADAADRQASRQLSDAQRKARKQEIRARLKTAKKTALAAAARDASAPAARPIVPSAAVVSVLVPAPTLVEPAHVSAACSAERMSAIRVAWKASPASSVSAPPFIRSLFSPGQDFPNLRRKKMTSRLKTAWTKEKRTMGVNTYHAPPDAAPAVAESLSSTATAAHALNPPGPLTKSGMRVAEDEKERARIIASNPTASAAELQQILYRLGFGLDGGSRQTRKRLEKKRRQRGAAAQGSAAAQASSAAAAPSARPPVSTSSTAAAARPASRSSHRSDARTAFSITDSDLSQSPWEQIVYGAASKCGSDDGSSDAGRSDSNFSEDSAASFVNQCVRCSSLCPRAR